MKTWQDKIIMMTAMIMGIMVIPMVLDGFNGIIVNPLSSLVTFVGLYILAICFLTLKFYLSSVLYIFNGTLWLILFIQWMV
jgi:hypothetical protein